MWNERYSIDDWFYGTAPNDFLAQNVTRLPCGEVLCLADGEGRNGVFLAQQGYAVTSLDQSSVGLEKARRLACTTGVTLTTICADLADADIGEARWEGVVSIFCHLPSTLRRQVHARACRALKPGGVLLLEAYSPRQLTNTTGGPKDADMLMTLEALAEELAPLRIEHLVECEREVVEGIGHTGRAWVVQVVAVRPV